MTDQKYFDVIIIGGSFSGLAAGMALGRALRQVLIIDSGKPCNWQTPNSHNFLTQDGKKSSMKALYTRCPFEQHCTIPEALGCEKTDQGYIKTDSFQKTTVHGIFASGDNMTRMRTVANAVAMGTTAGMTANKEIIEEEF